MDGGDWRQANDFLWAENRRLRQELAGLRRALALREDCRQALARLRRDHERLRDEHRTLERRLAEVTRQLKTEAGAPVPPPPFVKPNARRAKRKRPGRKAGHAPALRPAPAHVDVHQDVSVPVDPSGHPSCPDCKAQLADVRHHQRLVEDLVPSTVLVTCYHTTSGYCPSCRRRVESRAEAQPPAADVPHAQLGLDALCTAAMMRVCYRMPLRQVTDFFQQLPGLKISPGAIARQLQRLGAWLDDQYDRLKLSLRLAGVVYADETSWRTDGRNGQLWTVTNDHHTLYHVDASRGGKVIAGLLGQSFGADGRSTLVSDFYGAYQQFGGPQQKCLAHLSREIRDLLEQRPGPGNQRFFRACRRLIRDMLKLRDQRQKLPGQAYEHRVDLVERRLEKLAEGRWDDPDAARLATRLKKNRGKLTTFLHDPRVEPTNNRAERALRPAVVMRKVTGGSRSAKGAGAWARLASIMRTCQQQGRPVLQTLKDLLTAAWAGRECTLLTDLLTTPAPAGR